MTRYLYSTGFLVCCLGLPLKAKEKSPCTTNHVKEKAVKTALSSKNQPSSPAYVASSTESSDESDEKPKAAHRHTHAKVETEDSAGADQRLARLTAYWSGEGDYYTGHGISSTGVRLHEGLCAVDPHIIPYGSEVNIAGLGTYVAADTGSAVISREAARETGHTSEERNALVIDLYFESRAEGERFAASGPKFAAISWHSSDRDENVLKKHSSLADDNN